MLSRTETKNTAYELQENYRRLGYPASRVARDTEMTEGELADTLRVRGADPGRVWELRDYLEDMLNAEGIELYPFSRLADHSANHWYYYETPWRDR